MPNYSDFDANQHIEQLPARGGGVPQDYLAVRNRIIWFRKEHPNGRISSVESYRGLLHIAVTEWNASTRRKVFKGTEEVQGVIFHAVVADENGNLLGEDYACETANDFGDFYEKCSTKAIGRALGLAGYGTSGAAEFNESDGEGNLSLPDSPIPEQTRKFKTTENSTQLVSPKAESATTSKAVVTNKSVESNAIEKCEDCGNTITGYKSLAGQDVSVGQIVATSSKMFDKKLCRKCHVNRIEDQQKVNDKKVDPVVEKNGE